jgi:hypothetical protein
VPGRLDGWRLAFNHRVRPWPQGFLVLCRCPNAIEPAHLVPLRTVRWAVQGAMGNIMQDAGAAVHGALYRLQPMDLARLTNMEHEYRRVGLVMSAEVLQPLSTKQPAQGVGRCMHRVQLLPIGTLHLLGTMATEGFACACRPTEVMVTPYDGRPPMRAVAFTSPQDCLIREGLPPSERWGLALPVDLFCCMPGTAC